MPDTPLDDDYIIALLEKDAKAHQNRPFTTANIQPRSKNAPKPNTRFLNNLIRDTNSHNAALKAKEQEESRERLRELRGLSRTQKKARDENGSGGEDVGRDGQKRARTGEERPGRWASALGGLSRSTESRSGKRTDRGDDVRERRKEGRDERKSREHRHRERGDHGSERKRRTRDGRSSSRSASPDRYSKHSIKRHDHHHRRRSRDRSASPRRRDTHNHATHHSRRHSVSPHQRRHRSRSPIGTHKSPGSDSDPLSPILGPALKPEILPRGRGATQTSTIDARFRDDYDPRTDVSVDAIENDDDGDWALALEGLRARVKGRQAHADRLRAAGFTEKEIGIWGEKGNAEPGVEDVTWSGKGEGREWDKGKVLDDDGHVQVKSNWAM